MPLVDKQQNIFTLNNKKRTPICFDFELQNEKEKKKIRNIHGMLSSCSNHAKLAY